MNCCVEVPDQADQFFDITDGILCPILVRKKIPRPPNAFMLYANEHRKTMAHLYPAESNKEISRRLGQTWKDLSMQDKNKYFQKAKDIDQEHKRKYPGYVYNPKDARVRKAIRSNLKLPRSCYRRANDIAVDYVPRIVITDTGEQMDTWNLSTSGQLSENSPYYSKEVSGEHMFGPVPVKLVESHEERTLFEKEKTSLEAAESYAKFGKVEDFLNYLPISSTKFIKDPELFTNNSDYHKEYILKYFNHIPDYETYNVTTEDGVSFPYVTIPNIPNLIVRSQNVAGVPYN